MLDNPTFHDEEKAHRNPLHFYTPSSRQITLTDIVFYDFNELLQLKQAVNNFDQARYQKIQQRLVLFLSAKRDSDYQEKLKAYTLPEVTTLYRQYYWQELTEQVSYELRQNRKQDVKQLVDAQLEKVCLYYRDKIHANKPGLPQQELDFLTQELQTHLHPKTNSLVNALKKINDANLKEFNEAAKEATIAIQKKIEDVQMLWVEYSEVVIDTEKKLKAHTVGRNNDIDATQRLDLSVDDKEENILDKAIALKDPELIKAVLAYAEHLDTCRQTGYKVNLVRSSLHKAYQREDLLALRYLANHGCLCDSAFMILVHNPALALGDDPQKLFPRWFDERGYFQEDVLARLIQQADDVFYQALIKDSDEFFLAVLIRQANEAMWPLLVEALKARFALKENEMITDFPMGIWQALQAKLAKDNLEKRCFQKAVHYFYKLLQYITSSYPKDPGYYLKQLRAIVNEMQNDFTEANLLEQCLHSVKNLMGNEHITDVRDTCCAPRASKSYDLVRNIEKSLLNSMSSKRVCPTEEKKHAPTSERFVPMPAKTLLDSIDQITAVILGKQQQRERWLFVYSLFPKTLAYLEKRKIHDKKDIMSELINNFSCGKIQARQLWQELNPHQEHNVYSQLAKKVGWRRSTTGVLLRDEWQQNKSLFEAYFADTVTLKA